MQQPCAKRALRLAHAHWVARPQARLRLARSAEVPWQAPALHRVAYMSEITELLRAVQAGDHASLDAVFERVYAELRTLAAARLASQPGESTLSATALVHESYLKLSDASQLSLTDRKHFFACAARAMRQILVDRARARGADKRGGGMEPLTLSHAEGIDADTPEVLDLDVALNQLDEIDGALRELVELRVFAGLTLQQVADTSGRSLRSVNRDWQRARALLLAQMD
ncbi:ECF-type sigma factor [Dokdonella sp.]|uniref:ECF-type sigma factor n=4 Tax=Dokdonella sp. TaxID=2291710 RepID=UPI0025BBE4B5|nr:ECF-type sigma factor [Dokdonella sp.]